MRERHYSDDFKKSAVEKMLNRGGRQISAISEETGVARPTLYQWKKKFGNVLGMKKIQQRPQDKAAKDKFKAVIEYEKLPEDKRGEFLRRHGLHIEHIEEWREQMQRALIPCKDKKVERSERAVDRRKIKELETEIKRKDKALAETAALLVLKKKANLIWGIGEDE